MKRARGSKSGARQSKKVADRTLARRVGKRKTLVVGRATVVESAVPSIAAERSPARGEAEDCRPSPGESVLSQPQTSVQGLETTALPETERDVPLYESSEVSDDRDLEFLGFRLDDEEYAVMISAVREIIRLTDVTPVPRGPEGFLGIISLRGTIVPILDVRWRLGLSNTSADPESRIVVVSFDETLVGMVVDQVTEVIATSAEALDAPPATMGARQASCVMATLQYGERLIGVVDLERLVASDWIARKAA